jgi:hypothetical protein
MDIDEFRQIISLEHEITRVEFKPPFMLQNREMLAKVVRAVLAMANTRDGGKIIIGVEEKSKKLIPCGLSQEQEESLSYDNLSQHFSEYADPNVEFDTNILVDQEKRFLIINVKEFSLIPVLCKKEFNNSLSKNPQVILKKGQCYVRSTRKPESVEIPTQTEMRELLDLSIVKGIRKFISQANQAQLDIIVNDRKVQTKNELHEKPQTIPNMLSIEKLKFPPKIKTRGYWEFTIKPSISKDKRVPKILELKEILNKTQVQFGSWEFPFTENKDIKVKIDWIEQDFEWQHKLESWRFFQNGNFYDIYAIPSDWRDQSTVWTFPDSWEPLKEIGIGDIISTIHRFYEFSARLAMTEAGDEMMELDINLCRINGRSLIQDFPHKWPFDFKYSSSIDSFPIHNSIDRNELISNTQLLTINAAVDVFDRFGWNISNDNVHSLLNEIISKWY